MVIRRFVYKSIHDLVFMESIAAREASETFIISSIGISGVPPFWILCTNS